ncbi:IS66-like element accessory protein TnpA [Reyranella sp.]|uniref:IS66-like element accessory protein TnpA n=1 Tax=Reyranella sp. TaxID=1929291 RepID=UPI00403706EA
MTGAGGRRRWTMDAKARVVEATLEPGAPVSVVARRHGLAPQQVLAWRRESRQRSEEAGPQFVPVVEMPSTHQRRRQQAAPMAPIELEIGSVRVRIGDGATASIVSAVIRVLKAIS